MNLKKCPRCKNNTLNVKDCGESGLYRSRHLICVPCFHDEYKEIEEKGTNNLPETLAHYGAENEI